MAFKEPDVDGAVSEWNEALFKMKRLHELQTEINKCNMMPLSKHFMNGEWNYIILFRCISALYSEGNAKYKAVELEEVNALKNVIAEHIRICPPHKAKGKIGGSSNIQWVFDEKNWELLKKLLEDYEYKVRLYNDKHGLSTQNKESMDGRSILR